jgi:hypothetical protein
MSRQRKQNNHLGSPSFGCQKEDRQDKHKAGSQTATMLNIRTGRSGVLAHMVTIYITEMAGVSKTSTVDGVSGHVNSKGSLIVRS